MKTKSRIVAWTAAAVLAVGCAETASDEGLVARVGGYTLEVDAVADLLVNEERFEANVTVVQQVAALWLEYVLLAEAAAQDSTFSDIDMEPLVRQQVDQLMILQLRDSVVSVDTMITDDELRALYEADDPPVEVRARHILLAYQTGAPAERDAIRSQIEALRARILSGESFEALARQYSADPGTAPLGGDLGFFRPGDMLAPLEDAAMALDEGQVSDPVETQFGLHLVKLEERRIQGFEEIAADFRSRVITQRYLTADSVFVAGVDAESLPVVREGTYELVRELAANPAARLAARGAGRSLVDYSDGTVTVGEVQEVLRGQAPEFWSQVTRGEDEEIDRFLRSLVQRELLVARAREGGLEPSGERLDSLITDARAQLVGAAHALELIRLDQAPGEPLEQAVQRSALEAVGKVLSGTTELVQLGAISFQLQRGHSPLVFERGVGQAVLRVGQLRANRSPSILEQSVDTAGRNP